MEDELKPSDMPDLSQGMAPMDAPAPDFHGMANLAVTRHLDNVKDNGIMSLAKGRVQESQRSATDKFVNGSKADETDELPMTPGFAYSTHLFKLHNVGKKIKQAQEKALTKGTGIYTDHMEALKTALMAMGVFSERNPSGMPLELKEVKKVFFGGKDVDPIEEAQWRTSIENGDTKVDPKKVRKFVNYDGSLTWEMLNDDKTVMSRFTMGEYAGQKIFTQGGHSKFAEMLNKVREKMGPDNGADFDAMTDKFGG